VQVGKNEGFAYGVTEETLQDFYYICISFW